jgi:hypothetical protein
VSLIDKKNNNRSNQFRQFKKVFIIYWVHFYFYFPHTIITRHNFVIAVLEMKIWIYWSESNIWIYYIYIHVSLNYQVSVHMAKQFQRRRFFRNRQIRNKNFMWWPCLLTDRDEISNLHRGHSINDSYQVSVVAMFVNGSERNQQSS